MLAITRHYRWMFAAHWGEYPPWKCGLCSEQIWSEGQEGHSLVRHHIDGDQTNNSKDNLVPAHRSCHNKEHAQPNSVMSDVAKVRVAQMKSDWWREVYYK